MKFDIPSVKFACAIVFLLCAGCWQERDCSGFRTGNFYHPLENGDTAFVQRNDSVQIEVRPKYAMMLRVRWMNECEYELRTVSLSEKGKIVPVSDSLKDIRVNVKIVETTKEYYIFNASRTDGLAFSDTLWVGRKVIGGFKAIGGVFDGH